jgi:hypothetical protein
VAGPKRQPNTFFSKLGGWFWNEIIWVKCQWTREQLDGKTVEFRCRRGDNGVLVSGRGKFHARKNPDGLLRIFIDSDLLPASTDFLRIYVPQEGADAIERHRTGSEDFEYFPAV